MALEKETLRYGEINAKENERTTSLTLNTNCPEPFHDARVLRISKESLNITHEPITYGDKLGSRVSGSRGPIIILS